MKLLNMSLWPLFQSHHRTKKSIPSFYGLTAFGSEPTKSLVVRGIDTLPKSRISHSQMVDLAFHPFQLLALLDRTGVQ
jgi:hypothetical protein